MKKWEDWDKCWLVGRYNSNLLFVETEQKSFCLRCGQMVKVWGASFKITNNGLLEKGICIDCSNKIRSYRKYHYVSLQLLENLHWGRHHLIGFVSGIKQFYHTFDHTPKYREIKRVMILQPYEVDMMNDSERLRELLMKCENETSLNYWRNNMTDNGRKFEMPQMWRSNKQCPNRFYPSMNPRNRQRLGPASWMGLQNIGQQP